MVVVVLEDVDIIRPCELVSVFLEAARFRLLSRAARPDLYRYVSRGSRLSQRM